MRVAIIAFDAVVGVARFVSKRIPAVISARAPPAVLLAATSIAFGTALTPALLSPLTFLVLVYRAAGSRRAPGGGGSSGGDPQLLLRGLGVLALVVVAFDAGPLAAWATRGRGSDSGLQLLHGVAAARWELWLGAPLLALGVAADRPIRGRGRSMRLVTMVAAVLATVVPASHLYLVKWIIAAWAASHFCATVI
ncbi:hypothetical protein DFJ73DRAFT_760395 [Zopfochytrium polystomum]|nr:hypothetical protein DFJ73DRAFT_760395 [Zopfochytrium polystomum]